MISLDQVLLLQKKVEIAVNKISQLKTENDALRRKCAELTNALSAKTEQISSFQADETKIEEGILKALDKLNSIENSVLGADPSAGVSAAIQKTTSDNLSENLKTEHQTVSGGNRQEESIQSVQKKEQTIVSPKNEKKDNDFSSGEDQPLFGNSETPSATPENDGQFDIF
ncbi:MAG: cell division protein ZapB [Treponema sp.]|jgi:chromosome segregation ATPase|nr:cell division protein ZapB [Treponema sp.]